MTAGIDPTKKFFEQVSGKQLTDAEISEYKNKLVKLFSILIKIDQRIKGERKVT